MLVLIGGWCLSTERRKIPNRQRGKSARRRMPGRNSHGRSGRHPRQCAALCCEGVRRHLSEAGAGIRGTIRNLKNNSPVAANAAIAGYFFFAAP